MFNGLKMRTLAEYDAEQISKYGYAGVLISMIGFHICNKVVDRYLIPDKFVGNDVWKWKNLLVSWVHSLIAASWTLGCMVLYPEMFDDLVNHFTPLSYALVVFSTGYFLYDFGDLLVNNKLLKLWELTLHHIAVTSTFIYNTYYMTCVAFTCVALLAETNTIFLHSRKLMQMYKVPFDSKLYRANCYVNIVTFVLGRGTALFKITSQLILTPYAVSYIYWWILSGSMFIMNSIHPILFWRLFKSDFIKPMMDKKRASNKRQELNGFHKINGLNGYLMNNNEKQS